MDLQALLPLARVVYSSATGVTSPRDMGYMTRLGLWGPGTYFPEGLTGIPAQHYSPPLPASLTAWSPASPLTV